jgi:hypothetical protein
MDSMVCEKNSSVSEKYPRIVYGHEASYSQENIKGILW